MKIKKNITASKNLSSQASHASENLSSQTSGIPFFKPNYWLAIITAMVGFLLYVNTISNDYAIDDAVVTTDNQYVQQGLKGIPAIFTVDVWHFNNSDLGYYRPLSMSTFAIENEFTTNNPHASHFVNVFLYALTGFFLCLLLMNIFNRYHSAFSFFISLLFIAHPIHTEVVANIKSRDEILSLLNLVIAVFILFRTMGLHQKDFKRGWRSTALLALSYFFFYLALLSKETAMIGVLLVPVILFFMGQFSIKEILKTTAPFLVLMLLFQFQKYMILGSLTGAETNDIVSFPYANEGSSLANMFLLFAWYVKMVIVPYPLSYNYAYNQLPATDWISAGAVAGLILFIGLLFICLKGIRKRSALNFGALIFGIAIIPAMAFTLLKGGILAERFLYAPALGFCIVLTWSIYKLAKLSFASPLKEVVKKGVAVVPLLLVFCLYSFATISRNPDWHDDMTLSSHDAAVTPNSCQVHLHYGKKLIDTGVAEKDPAKRNEYFDKGVEQLQQALRIYPHYAAAFFKLGYAYQVLRVNDDSAIYYYKRTIEAAPGYARAYNNLGTLYEKAGNQQEAACYYNKAVELNPYLSNEAKNRERFNKQSGQSSIPNLDSLEQNTPTKDFRFYTSIGIQYTEQNDFKNGVRCLQKAIDLQPYSAEALVNISVCYGKMKAYDKSEASLLKALQLDPNNVQAVRNLAALYQRLGNKEKEMEYRKRLGELDH